MNPCRQMQAAIGPETDETTSDMIIQAYFKSDNAPLMSLLGISLFCTPDSSLPPQPLLSPPRKMLSLRIWAIYLHQTLKWGRQVAGTGAAVG